MTDVKMTDKEYMGLAPKLAQRREGQVNPNPLVGAVIAKDGTTIGRGYHREYGGPHAEREALASLTRTARGATLYIVLGLYCHCGKTPPCTNTITESGVSRVVIGTADPNPLVAGKGISLFSSHRTRVVQGVFETKCISQNQIFFHFAHTKQPCVMVKYVMTTDGKTVTCTGWSGWITGDEVRVQVHRDRNRYNTITVGVGTILKDNPPLTCYLSNGRDPVRVIRDIRLRISTTSGIISTAGSVRAILATFCTEEGIIRPYEKVGYGTLVLPQADGRMGLAALIKWLRGTDTSNVLLEGGVTLNWLALSQGLIHKVQAYVAPKLFGGKDAPSPVDGKGMGTPGQAFFLKQPRIAVLGDDILLGNEVPACLQAQLKKPAP